MQLIVFFLILLTGYVYVWRKGVFDWGHERDERRPPMRRCADYICLKSKFPS